MKYLLVVFTLILVLPLKGLAQENQDEDGSRSPYELMSSYYSGQFKPFKKGNVYTGLAFSLSDRNLSNVDQLVQNVVDGQDNAFNIVLKGGYYTGDYAMIGLNFEYAAGNL